jgi:hypothetical protein
MRSDGGVGVRRRSFWDREAERLLALSLLAWGIGASAWAAPAPDGQSGGVPLVGSLAVAETTGQIMARQAIAARQPRPQPRIFFLGRADTRGKKVDPAGEGLVQGPAPGSRLPNQVGGPEPLALQVIGVNADGPASGSSPCGTPPDTMGAVGPTQFIVAVNCNIVSYSKATGAADGVLNTTPDVFFASVRSNIVSDPHIRYDRTSRRWFIVIIDVTFPNNRVLLAVSNTATVTNTTVWTFFFFQSAIGTHTSCLADYPTPGIDANAIYIGVNQFCGSSLGTATFKGSDGYVVQKSSALGGGPIHVTGFQNLGIFPSVPGQDAYTPQGVDNPDPAATEGYFLGGSIGFFNRLNLVRVSNPGSLSPTVSSSIPIVTANQGTPITQPHLGNTGGTNGRLDASDNRPFAAAFRAGSLWTSMDVGTDNTCAGVGAGTATRDAVFWWELGGIPTGSTPAIRQAGILCDTAATSPAFYSYGTIVANGQGHAALGYSIAGTTHFVSAGTSGRLAGDPSGSLQSVNTYRAGAAAYNPSFDTGATNGFRRWGDFSFTSLDPCDDMTLWTIQEYVPVVNQYGVRFAQLKAPPPATPASASPATLAPGLASVDVVVTGTSSGGSGFYDTPASLAGETCRLRLAAAVSGVTVNGVTFTDPTHVTLHLSTVGATTGTKTVTLTNPDGQAASAAVLTVATPPPPPTASNNGPLCAGETLQLNASTVAGATYAWTGPNAFSSAQQNPTIAGATTAATGTYSVTATVATLTSLPGTTVATVNPLPGTPVITVAPTVGAGTPGHAASVAAHAGASYAWTIGNGTITAGQGTSAIAFTAGAAGTLTLSVTETSSSGCASAAGTATVTVEAPGAATQFYTVTPCRRLDTRAGSPVPPGGTLTVPLTGDTCGIPATAVAVSVNVTVTQPTAPGNLKIYPTTSPRPLMSVIDFVAGLTRANNAIVALANDGSGTVDVFNDSGGTVHLTIDVNGYFE